MDLLSAGATLELVGHYGRLRARLRPELGQSKLVVPTNEHFPDRFDGSQAAAQRLVHRMQTHAHMTDIPVRVAISDETAATGNSCSSGACSSVHGQGNTRLELQSDGWTLQLSASELTHPVVLTGTVARALGAVFLEETRPDGAPLPAPVELNIELCAVQLGFGVLMLEASHVYTKSCSGPRVTQLTLLSASELALLVALFAAENQLKLKPALKASSLTQRTLLGEARDLVHANPRLQRWIVQANTTEPTPGFTLNEARKDLFAGVLDKLSLLRSKPAAATDLEAWLDATPLDTTRALPSQKVSPALVRKPDDELKALVAEALDANASGH